MRELAAAVWTGFVRSYDQERATLVTAPSVTAANVLMHWAAILPIAFAPAFESASFQRPWVSIALVLLGGGAAWLAWRHGCRGRWGAPAALVDNAFFVAALSWAACHTTPSYGIFYAACLALLLVGGVATTYGLSVAIVVVTAIPPLSIAAITRPAPIVELALLLGLIVGWSRMAVLRRLRQHAWNAQPSVQGVSGMRYRIGPEVGRGGMGVVHRTATETGDPLAVKLLNALETNCSRSMKSLLKEVLLVNGVRHPGVVPIVDYGFGSEGRPFLVMELLDGRTLAQHLVDAGGRLPWRQATSLAIDVLDVLDSAHARGIIHCDVKPNNVFLCRDGRVKLLDFGIARAEVNVLELTVSAHIAGTPSCMAPEQALNPSAVDARSDVWGVAATLFRALTGEWPRDLWEPCQSLAEAVQRPARPIGSVLPSLPTDLARVIDGALRTEPHARWRGARPFREQLLACLLEPEHVPLSYRSRMAGGVAP